MKCRWSLVSRENECPLKRFVLRATRYVGIAACGFLGCQLRGARDGTKPASDVTMPPRRVLDVIPIAVLAILGSIGSAHSQPSTAPPSSLPVTPLTPNINNPAGPATCDLCRALEGRAGSDLPRHRHGRQKDLRPHKQAPGMTASPKRSLMSQLPHHKLEANHDHEDR
jgi:hypothetical protein